jgi:hypothetical protein
MATKSVVSKLLLVTEVVAVLVAVVFALALRSAPAFLPCGGCPDPSRNTGDFHRIALRVGITVVGILVAYLLDALRRRLISEG